jgi:hypothetical protein
MEFRAIDPDSGRSEAAELQVLSGSDRRRLGRLASGEVCLIELKNALVSLPTIARYQHQD